MKRDTGISANMHYSKSTLESRIRVLKAMRMHKYANQKAKLNRLFYKTMHGFLRLFMNSGLRVILCSGAPNVHVTGAKLDRSSMTDAEIWPESPNGKEVT